LIKARRDSNFDMGDWRVLVSLLLFERDIKFDMLIFNERKKAGKKIYYD